MVRMLNLVLRFFFSTAAMSIRRRVGGFRRSNRITVVRVCVENDKINLRQTLVI